MTAFLALLLAGVAAEQPRPPGIAPLRYEEDWRPLCRSLPQSSEAEYKCLGDPDGLMLSLGGELRLRTELSNGALTRPEPDRQALLVRQLVHADIRLDSSLRVFLQGGTLQAIGEPKPFPAIQQNDGDLSQLFLDYQVRSKSQAAMVRLGRQEMAFGSQRLIALRDGPNQRLAFDGVRMRLDAGQGSVDAFVTWPVQARPGLLDDTSGAEDRLAGVYVTQQIAGPLKADLYLLERRQNANSPLAPRPGGFRQSLGARLFGRRSGFDWDVEAVIQRGFAGGQRIRAWTLASDVGFTFGATALEPRISLKVDLASGDRRPGDGISGTFDPLYPKLPYFSEANLVVPANLVDINPGISLRPQPSLLLSANWDFLWRHRLADAIYTAPLAVVQGSSGQGSRYIGDQKVLTADWSVNRHLRLYGQAVSFRPGQTLRQLGGRSIEFLVVSASLRF